MQIKPRRISIHGKRWTVYFRSPTKKDDECVNEGDLGLCLYHNNKIFVTPNDDAVGTLLHELLHVLFPQIKEESIAQAEKVLMKGLALYPNELQK
jgi:hypothetical protein